MILLIEDKVLARIQQLLTFNQWSLYKLAKESGLPYSSLNNLIHRGTCPTISTLEKICHGFDISLTDFFDFPKNPLRNETISEEEQCLINAYTSLSQKDKDLLIAYLKGLQHSHRP